jgi:hypothetical protein
MTADSTADGAPAPYNGTYADLMQRQMLTRVARRRARRLVMDDHHPAAPVGASKIVAPDSATVERQAGEGPVPPRPQVRSQRV